MAKDNNTGFSATQAIAARALSLSPDHEDMRWARHCLLDWLGVTIAAAHEPLVDILVSEARDDASGPVPIVGRPETVSASWAVLINGAASHALDYDDVNRAMHGHPTVAVMPAVLIAGMREAKGFDAVLRAFIAGYEVACLVGEMSGDAHYDAGWHATGTVGAFGAAAGAGILAGLDAQRMMHAFGTVATTTAGLKASFGTMSKPLHAGRAAQAGYLAARTAARGWVAREDILECPQGFWDTHSPAPEIFDPVTRDNRPNAIRGTLFKYNAACYMTHSTIEACRSMATTQGLDPAEIEAVDIHVAEGHLKVCNIPDPETGLEVKFSLRHTAAMAFSGVDTGRIDSYTDEIAQRPDLVTLRRQMTVRPVAGASTMETGASITVRMKSGETLASDADVGIPATDSGAQEVRLMEKFETLAEPALGVERTRALAVGVLTGAPGPKVLLEATRPRG